MNRLRITILSLVIGTVLLSGCAKYEGATTLSTGNLRFK